MGALVYVLDECRMCRMMINVDDDSGIFNGIMDFLPTNGYLNGYFINEYMINIHFNLLIGWRSWIYIMCLCVWC